MTSIASLIRSRTAHAALLAARLCTFAPLTAQDTFYAHFGTNTIQTAGHITPSLDNAFYGVSRDGNDDIYVYKVDQAGDLLWIKAVTFGQLIFPTTITTLSDNSFAFLAWPAGTAPSVLCKVDEDGDVVWVRTLFTAAGGNFLGLAPTTDGGMMLTGGGCAGADMILHVDPQGHILSQHGHASYNSNYWRPNARKMIHEGNNQYAYMGHATDPGATYRPITFSRSDSAGNVYGYKEIHFPLGISTSVPMGETMVRSANGGHYITTAVDDTAMNHVVLFYLNAQDQLEWFKKIATPDLRITADALVPTEDGGCVLVGGDVVNMNPYLYHTYAIKFSEQGDMLWSRMFGDTAVAFWDRLGIQHLLPAADGGFLATPIRWSAFDLCKVDAAFNGYCYDKPFVPLVTDLEPTVIPYPITPTAILFVEDSLSVVSVTSGFPRINYCSSFTGIEEERTDLALIIAPNPATDHFQLFLPIDRPQRVEVSLTNSLGAVCSFRQFEALPDRPVVISTSEFPPGAYIVEVRTPDMGQRARLIVQH